jgi:hypothetical protein
MSIKTGIRKRRGGENEIAEKRERRNKRCKRKQSKKELG